MKSREDLVRRALGRLRVLAAGQTPSAEDAKLVDDQINSVLADLSDRSIYSVGDPDQIEDSAFQHLSVFLANAVAEDFGTTPNVEAAMLAERSLRHITAQTLSGQRQTAEYF